jgi:hypothetical protein
MDYQTIFIIVIIVFFNILLLNILRLQNDIYNMKSDMLPGLLDDSMMNYKNINSNVDISKKLNEIASQVPIDINKIEKSKDILLPKYKQIKHT